MATTTKKTEKKTGTKRNRRTPDQIVADLEAEIERVKRRAATKQAKQSEEGKALFAAARALDKAIEAATQAGNDQVKNATEAARAILSEAMIEMGVRLPDPKGRRGRKPRTEAA